MRQFFLLLSILTTFTACENTTGNNNTSTPVKPDSATGKTIGIPGKEEPAEADPAENNPVAEEFKTFRIYKPADTIRADLNGDKVPDQAYFSSTTNKALFITDGKTGQAIQIGLDKSFENIGAKFNWVDFWGTTDDPETYEVVIQDGEITSDRKIKLENTSLFVRKNEAGGGVITYKNGKFIWVHQAD